MLPDIRFVFGALMVIAVTGMIGVGLFVSARLFHQAKMGPIESRRNLAFTDSAEWNQFHDAGSVRRYVGLTRQGETREVEVLLPDHRPQAAAPPAREVDLAPVEVSKRDDAVRAFPPPEQPIDPAVGDVASPVEPATAVVPPSVPDQAYVPPPLERAVIPNAEVVTDMKAGPAETVVAHASPMPIHGAPPASEEHPPTSTPAPASIERTVAGTLAIETGHRRAGEPPGTPPVGTEGTRGPAAVTGKADMALAAEAETPLPQPPKAPLPAAPHSPAAPAKAISTSPAPRTPVKRVARDNDDDDESRRPASTPRARVLASRSRTAAPTYGPWLNGTQTADPRRYLPGQPVFGPHFPYATPQPGQPHFGPHFPYATPQPSRQQASRAAQSRSYAQPSYDPRLYAPQPSFRQPRQPSYGPSYGWR